MAWNVKEKIKRGWNWMTAHPISFGRMLGMAGIGITLAFSFIILQIVLGAISGWLLILEILLAALYFVMCAINGSRQLEIDRKKRGYPW